MAIARDSLWREILRVWNVDEYTIVATQIRGKTHMLNCLDRTSGEITSYSGQSWRDIYVKYFKPAILEFLEDDSVPQDYFTDCELSLIKSESKGEN